MVLILVVLFIAFIILCILFTPRFKNGSETSSNINEIKQDEPIKKQDDTTQAPVQEEKQEELPKQVEPKKEINYVAILEIPKINLKKGLVDKNSKDNNVDKNIYTCNFHLQVYMFYLHHIFNFFYKLTFTYIIIRYY